MLLNIIGVIWELRLSLFNFCNNVIGLCEMLSLFIFFLMLMLDINFDVLKILF